MDNVSTIWLPSIMVMFVLLCLFHDVELSCMPTIPCFSPPINVAKLPSYKLSINSTCGTPPEFFCVGRDCSFRCDASNNKTRHPARDILDAYESVTYWKSANFDEPVFLQFDFKNKLILHQITITFQFELPSALYIQRSQDFSQSYTTLAYFAGHCNHVFGMKESLNYKKLDVLCYVINPGPIQRQISYAPRRDDYVATEILKGSFVRDYYLASNIRIVLQEFSKPVSYNHLRGSGHKYYFAIRDIDIQASCYCNGMSSQCSPRDHGTCICHKQTEGQHCERCLPSHNNKEWQFGQACEACDCNNLATKCVYDQFKKHGVCKNCQLNTMGDHCELCPIGFYGNKSTAASKQNTCVACKCYGAGVLVGSKRCNPHSGKCYCRPNVSGFLCDRCKDGFYGLTAASCGKCLPCACKRSGSSSLVCDKVSGICPCKLGFTGRTCSKCIDGYFGYPMYNPAECRDCSCRPSGAVSMLCDATGQCQCRTNYYGVKCEQIKIGFYSASVNQLSFSSTDAVITSPVPPAHLSLNIKDSGGNTFGVLGYSVGLGGYLIPDDTQLKFNVNTPAPTLYDVYLQYITSYDFKDVVINITLKSVYKNYACDKNNVKVSSTSYTLKTNIHASSESTQLGSHCLVKGAYDIFINFPPECAGLSSNSAKIFIISLLLLPDYKHAPRFISANTHIQTHIMQYYLLASSYQLWPTKESRGAKYLSYIYGSYYNNAFECGCNNMGTINPHVCNIYGGQCNCKKNIYGRICHRCLPEYYNFLSGLGCDACDCDVYGSHAKACSYSTGQCRCKPNVIGRNCNKCKPNFYGITSGNGCKPVQLYTLYNNVTV